MTAITSLIPRSKGAWMLVSGVVGIVLMGAIILMGPVQSRMRELEDEIAAKEKDLGRNLAIVAPTAREAVEKDFKQYGEIIRMRGSSDEEKSLMLSEIDKLAGLHKVGLTATKPHGAPEDAKDKDICEEFGVDLEIEAEMSALIGFLYALEASPQFLRVENLVLESKGPKDASSLRGTLLVTKVVTR
jgi:hypothetical protein